MMLCTECKQDKARTNAGLCISCNEGMIEELTCDAIRYRKRAKMAEGKAAELEAENEKLKKTLELHAGDVCSLHTEIDVLTGEHKFQDEAQNERITKLEAENEKLKYTIKIMSELRSTPVVKMECPHCKKLKDIQVDCECGFIKRGNQ